MYNYTIYERFYQGGAGNRWEFFSVRNVAEKDSHRFLAATDTKVYWYKYIKVAPGYLAERDDSMADLENILSGTGKKLRGVSTNTQVSDLRSLQIDTSARLS